MGERFVKYMSALAPYFDLDYKTQIEIMWSSNNINIVNNIYNKKKYYYFL